MGHTVATRGVGVPPDRDRAATQDRTSALLAPCSHLLRR